MGFFSNRERKAPGETPQLSAAEREFVRTRPGIQNDRAPSRSDFAHDGLRDALNELPRPFGSAGDFIRPRQETPIERPPAEPDPSSMLESATHAQVREIDVLIADLQRMRDVLNSEASRVERAMVEYAAFSGNALQSSKVICESLRSGLRPFQEKRHKEKGRSRARRKAARRLARMSARLANVSPLDPEKSVG